MSSLHVLDANQLIPDDRLSFYGLLERVSDYSQDDPVHNNVDLYSGIDIAYNVFRFSVEALALLHRPAARHSLWCFAGWALRRPIWAEAGHRSSCHIYFAGTLFGSCGGCCVKSRGASDMQRLRRMSQ